MHAREVISLLKGAVYRVRALALEVGERRAALGFAETEYETKTKPGGEWTDAPTLTEEERAYRNKLVRDAMDMIKLYQKQLKEKHAELEEALHRIDGMHDVAEVLLTPEASF